MRELIKEAKRLQQLAGINPTYSKAVDNPDNIKIGDFITATYKSNPISGVVVDIKKDLVIVEQYDGEDYDFATRSYAAYRKRIPTQLLNIRKKSIYQVGLNDNETIIN